MGLVVVVTKTSELLRMTRMIMEEMLVMMVKTTLME